jgi:Tol biopolymer transport system component
VGQAHDYNRLRLSPDGTRIAAVRGFEATGSDIWLTAISGGGDTRFTFDPAPDDYPTWSPDGSRIAFSSDRTGNFDLYVHASDGAGEDELLFKSDHTKFVTDWSRDGRFLLYYDIDPKTKRDLWVLPMDGAAGERKPVPFLRTGFNEASGTFSPDGHWVAYHSDESGRNEIYVRPFPAPSSGGGKWMVSQGGGILPVWRGDGKELFFQALDGSIMAAAVMVTGGATSVAFQPGPPKALFKMLVGSRAWDATADGKKFLLTVPVAVTAQTPFTIVLNWMSLLTR